MRPGRGEEEEEGRKSGNRLGETEGGCRSRREARPRWGRGAAQGRAGTAPAPAGSAPSAVAPGIEVPRVGALAEPGSRCCSSGSFGLPARVFQERHVQMRAVAFKEGKGPNIDIGEDKQVFVRLVISEYFEVVF